MKKWFATVGGIFLPKLVLAQAYSYGGDEITSSVHSAFTFIQKLALAIWGILIVLALFRLKFDGDRRDGLGALYACIIGILITALAPRIVDVVQSWAGGGLGY